MPARSLEPYQQLEIAWSEFNDLDPAGMVACSSGTAALHLALEALQLPPGSEVITSDFNMIAVPRAISLAGLTPVFVDCDERLLMDAGLINEACSKDNWDALPHWEKVRLKEINVGKNLGHLPNKKLSGITAAMAVHIYGRRCDMDKLHSAVAKYRRGEWNAFPVIEDLAEAHGVKPHPQTDAACWSFYKNKIIAGEEGGAVWFRDPEHAKLARQLRCLGFTEAHDFMHVPRGHNYRMSNLHAKYILRCECSILNDDLLKNINSLYRYPWIIEKRREMESWYDELCPDEWKMPPRDAPWVYDMKVRGMHEEQQTRLVQALNKGGIGARLAFKPMHVQEEYKNCRFVHGVDGDFSTYLAQEVFYLPIQPGVTTKSDAAHAFDIIHSVLS